MTWTQAIIVYVVCWWLLLFMALPFGVQQQQNVQMGLERAAPQKTLLGIKCLIVTVLAAFATWGIDIAIHSGIVTVN